MSMLSTQVDRLRKYAERLRQLANGAVNQCFPARQDLYESAAEMREAADTIESLRDRLQAIQGVGGESRYTALFGTPERAARTLTHNALSTCDECVLIDICDIGMPATCMVSDCDALLDWLVGDA